MTIEIPTPSADLISQIETATIETAQAEEQAVTAIRKRFSPYAKHNGFIQTGEYSKSDSNYSVRRRAHLMDGTRKVRGLRVYDNFISTNYDQNSGQERGGRLYLSEVGEWIEVARFGSWSQWQGAANWWYSSPESREVIELDDHEDQAAGAGVRTLSDAEVAAEYDLDDIIEELSKAMAELSKKLPARFAKLKDRAELATRVVAAAK